MKKAVQNKAKDREVSNGKTEMRHFAVIESKADQIFH